VSKINYFTRKAWKGFEGFPPKSAKAAYVYLVDQWINDNGINEDGSVNKTLVGKSTLLPTFDKVGSTTSTLMRFSFFSLLILLFLFLVVRPVIQIGNRLKLFLNLWFRII
jgi:hypothetical protein